MPSVYFAHDQQESAIPRRLAMELAGYEVSCFTNGVALCEALARALPDVVVMDVLLEGRNGFDVCRTLRTKYKPLSLPVILTTPIYRSRAYKEEAEAAGAQRYLLRPCQPEELVYLVNQLALHPGTSRERAA
jgi:CheY-like chemotaxis protein